MDTNTEQFKSIGWGTPVPESATVYWGARLINTRHEVAGIVHDRQTGVQAEDDGIREKMADVIMNTVMPYVRSIAKDLRGSDTEVHTNSWDIDGLGTIKVQFTPNGSCGYLYTSVWLEN